MTRRRQEGEWTDDVVGRFWNRFSQLPERSIRYFSEEVGTGIVTLLTHAGARSGLALDFGCGPGFLAEELLRAGFECYGVDSSARSVEVANRRCAPYSGWRGATHIVGVATGFEAASMDVICCVETLEHLRDQQIVELLGELWRVLKPGGVGLVTVPNDEDLGRSMDYCPFCDTEFHRMQHLRSFDTPQLSTVLATCGFEVVFCQGVDLERFMAKPGALAPPGGRLLARPTLAWNLAAFLDTIKPRLFPQGRRFRMLATPGRHLCAIVRKPAMNRARADPRTPGIGP